MVPATRREAPLRPPVCAYLDRGGGHVELGVPQHAEVLASRFSTGWLTRGWTNAEPFGLHPKSKLGVLGTVALLSTKGLQNTRVLALCDGLGLCRVTVSVYNPRLEVLKHLASRYDSSTR